MSHVCVCCCTFRRQDLLHDLLEALAKLDSSTRFGYSIVVVDNDADRSAEPVVTAFRESITIDVQYVLQPVQSIALARNAALDAALSVNGADFLAFIDDDEVPDADWLCRHVVRLGDRRWSGSLGPVRPRYSRSCPGWVRRGGFHAREEPLDGTELNWHECRTGNVLLRTSLFRKKENRFDEAFASGGEDRDLFRRLISTGHRFVWTSEAIVHETVPPHRCRRIFLLRRALLRGSMAMANRRRVGARVAKSVAARVAYTAALPFVALTGEHRSMRMLISACDHLGLFLQACGVRVIREGYLS